MKELGQQQEQQYPKKTQEDYSKPTIQHCQFPICPIHSNSKYCIRRAVGSLVPDVIKKVYNIPKQSERRKRELPIYRKIVEDKIKESDGKCVLKLPGCTIYAQGGDHRVKRSPSNYIDPDNIFSACNFCNTEKERLSKLAIQTGITISKFKK